MEKKKSNKQVSPKLVEVKPVLGKEIIEDIDEEFKEDDAEIPETSP